MKGTFQTVYYLQRLGSDYFDLILEYATWVLQTNSDAGMEVSLEVLININFTSIKY
jgi:Vam6/Vps39-like protein vacuolar protein sorting-associated protein 39